MKTASVVSHGLPSLSTHHGWTARALRGCGPLPCCQSTSDATQTVFSFLADFICAQTLGWIRIRAARSFLRFTKRRIRHAANVDRRWHDSLSERFGKSDRFQFLKHRVPFPPPPRVVYDPVWRTWCRARSAPVVPTLRSRRSLSSTKNAQRVRRQKSADPVICTEKPPLYLKSGALVHGTSYCCHDTREFEQ